MVKYYCDHCKIEINDYDVHENIISYTDENHRMKDAILCKKCMKEFKKLKENHSEKIKKIECALAYYFQDDTPKKD